MPALQAKTRENYCDDIAGPSTELHGLQTTVILVMASNFVRCIYLSIYVCMQNFRRCKTRGIRLTPGVAYLKIAYDQTADAHNIFPSALCGCH